MNRSTPGLLVHHQLITHSNSCMSIESVMPSSHLILCRPLLLPPSIFPSIRVFSIESVLHMRWPKYWSFSFNISPSNEYSGLISFRMNWFYLLAVQGTLKSLLLTVKYFQLCDLVNTFTFFEPNHIGIFLSFNWKYPNIMSSPIGRIGSDPHSCVSLPPIENGTQLKQKLTHAQSL